MLTKVQDMPLSYLESSSSEHTCSMCRYMLPLSDIEFRDDLPEIKPSVSAGEMESLVCISGYISRKDLYMNAMYLYFEKYWSYTQQLDHGGLNIPCDTVYQWCVFGYLMLGLCRAQTYGEKVGADFGSKGERRELGRSVQGLGRGLALLDP